MFCQPSSSADTWITWPRTVRNPAISVTEVTIVVVVLTKTMTALHGLAKVIVDTREFRNIFFLAVPAFDLAFFQH